ncbi:hypothetical protein ACFLSX_03295 [Calditrichota bacterium]
MKRIIKSTLLFFALCLPIIGLPGDNSQNIEIDDIQRIGKTIKLQKPTSIADEAVGVMDKGQLQNLTMNYGQITDTRYEDVGNAPTQYFYDFRYPRKNYTGLVDDFSVFFALPENSRNANNGNVIDGWTDNDNEDWIAKDGSYGETHYNPATDPNPHAEIKYPLDNPTTPFLAHSDLQDTWPIDANGNPFWPGYFRRDRITGNEVEGEFASDRDVYAVFDDSHNQQGNVIGIEVEMMAYCYGRPYADKFQFYEFYIHNKSGRKLENCWFGYYKDPDCSDYGEEILILPDQTFSDPNIPDIILQRDINGDIGGATVPNSKGVTEDFSFGIAILETPHNIGVNSFHYFQDAGPVEDQILWPIISSDPTDPDLETPSTYFHGSNTSIDDANLLYSQAKQDLVYIVASGPFTMEPDSVVKSTIVVAVGENDADFYAQIDQAVNMFDFKFIGPSAPPAPKLSFVADDQQVTLYWEASAETKADPFTGDLDFEGYRIYRSEDQGQTWGKEIIDAQGNLIGYVPLVQFDLDNDISGVDQRNPFTYLGDNTGLQHTFTDNTVNNGITYSYTIIAYDRGDSLIYSLESARGTSTADKNFITVTPKPRSIGYVDPSVDYEHINGYGKGSLDITVIDPNATTNDIYIITFIDSPATAFNVINNTTNETKITGYPINSDDMPVTDGFQVRVNGDTEFGSVKFIRDEFDRDVSDDSHLDTTRSWYVSEGAHLSAAGSFETRTSDYEIRFSAQGSNIGIKLGPSIEVKQYVPFEVWNITTNQQITAIVTDDGNGIYNEGEEIAILNMPYPNLNIGETFSVNLLQAAHYKIRIMNAPDDSLTQPSEGQKVKIITKRAHVPSDTYQFNINPFYYRAVIEDELKNIRVVPNPYIVGAKWEELQNIHQIHFMFLPPVCDINIYSISGEKIKTLKHTNYTGDEIWNMTNESNQAVAFGVYVYVVSTPQGGKHIGKFAIIR